MPQKLDDRIYSRLIHTISETNGLSLLDTLELMGKAQTLPEDIKKETLNFIEKLNEYRVKDGQIEELFEHPIGRAFFRFFKNFPLRYREEHIHLTGSLTAEFIYPRIKKLLEGPHKEIYENKIKAIYGENALPLRSVEDVDKLIRLKEGEKFDRYLEILFLAKLTLVDRKAHSEASYHLAESLWQNYNVGAIRLKFSLSRATTDTTEQIPGSATVSPEDTMMGLYEGLKRFKDEHPGFQFILSPCFRKEASFYDSKKFNNKKEDFDYQVSELRRILEDHPELRRYVLEVDTVGSEKDMYRKSHFQEMKVGFRKLQAVGLKIRSHHGETWRNLRTGIQSVDNAMNIWHVDAIEHGLSLGINPNYYFHSIFQRVMHYNRNNKPLQPGSIEYSEISSMDWGTYSDVKEKLLRGVELNDSEFTTFVKTKFHMAREVEHYQHDILNRMIDKQLSVIALPSSNKKLTGQFEDYKDHPFSWWEKKGLKLGVGTDNYITLNTNYVREMLILLFTDPIHLKITKLLLVCTGETRRPFMSQKLWQMRSQTPLEDGF
jgi:adenosine deaminase